MLPNASRVETAMGEWEHKRLKGEKERLRYKLTSLCPASAHYSKPALPRCPMKQLRGRRPEG